MTDHQPGSAGYGMRGVLRVLAWTLAWGVMGAALYISGVFNSPRTGPLWVALAGGAIAWGLAGAFTFPVPSPVLARHRHATGPLIWALAYLLSFGLTVLFTTLFPDTLGGILMMLLGLALGAAAGAFASTWLLAHDSQLRRSLLAAGVWLLAFFAGSYVALFGLYLGPEITKLALASVIGMAAALTLGSGMGAALGGLAAALLAAALTRMLRRSL